MKKIIGIDPTTGNEIVEKTVRYYIVDGNPNHKVWGESVAEIRNTFPEIKGKKLTFVQSEKTYQS